MSDPKSQPAGMSVKTATNVEYAIIGLGAVALLLIFQPFSLTLFGVGCALVVIAGLINNLLPLCEPGVPVSSLVKAGLVVVAIFVIVLVIALTSAYLYGELFVKP
jgi:hypothetical protein